MRYNIWRPLMLIMVALLTRGLVTNLCIIFGMSPDSAGDIGFIAMMLAALFMYTRITKHRRK